MTNPFESLELPAIQLARVEDARRGDNAALAALIRDFGPLVDRVIGSIVRDADDVDDVSQEVWITVSTRLRQLREPARFRPWLVRVARNRSLGWIRGRRDERATSGDELLAALPAPATDHPDARLAEDERRTRLWEALGRLSESDREALILRVDGERPYEEIAVRLHISRTAAEVRVSRARARLRQLASAAPEAPACGIPSRTLGALVASTLTPDKQSALRSHIADCADCAERVHTLSTGAAAYRQFGLGGLPLVASAGAGGHGLVGQVLGRISQLMHRHVDAGPAGAASTPATVASATTGGAAAGAAGFAAGTANTVAAGAGVFGGG
ncbi:MAG: sigma-70 family RNA polymerase sigma factor, partial [Chloroflexi bacterium]|nr:sigma-70 family RNA polymerase sigma factor [Chloroflexota bacterium]